jgi:hypothetical protein
MDQYDFNIDESVLTELIKENEYKIVPTKYTIDWCTLRSKVHQKIIGNHKGDTYGEAIVYRVGYTGEKVYVVSNNDTIAFYQYIASLFDGNMDDFQFEFSSKPPLAILE